MRKLFLLLITVFSVFVACETDEIFDLNEDIKALTATVYEHESESLERDNNNFQALQAIINAVVEAQAEVNAQLEAAIQSEEEARIAADEEERRISEEELAAEATIRAEADQVLTDDLAMEVLERKNDVAQLRKEALEQRLFLIDLIEKNVDTLNQKIRQEAAFRLAGDLANARAIAQERAARIQAIDDLTEYVDEQDAFLQEQIDDNETEINAINAELSESVDAINAALDNVDIDDASDLSQALANLANEADAAQDYLDRTIVFNGSIVLLDNPINYQGFDLYDETGLIPVGTTVALKSNAEPAVMSTTVVASTYNSDDQTWAGLDPVDFDGGMHLWNEGVGKKKVIARIRYRNVGGEPRTVVQYALWAASDGATLLMTSNAVANNADAIAQNASDIDDLEARAAALEAHITRLDELIDAAELRLDTVEGDIEAINDELDGIDTQLGTVSATLSSLATQISGNDTDIATINTTITSLQAAISANSSNTQILSNSLQAQITAANTKITNNASAIAAEKTKVTTLQSQMTTANSNISTLQTELDAAEADIATASATIAELQASVASNTAEIANLADNDAIAALQDQIDAAEASIATNLAAIQTAESKIDTNEAAIESLQSNYALVQTQVASITTEISNLSELIEEQGDALADAVEAHEELSDLVDDINAAVSVSLNFEFGSKVIEVGDVSIYNNTTSFDVTVELSDYYEFIDADASNVPAGQITGLSYSYDLTAGSTTTTLSFSVADTFVFADTEVNINVDNLIQGKIMELNYGIYYDATPGAYKYFSVDHEFQFGDASGPTETFTIDDGYSISAAGSTTLSLYDNNWIVANISWDTDGTVDVSYTISSDLDFDNDKLITGTSKNISEFVTKDDPCDVWSSASSSDVEIEVLSSDIINSNGTKISVTIGSQAYSFDYTIVQNIDVAVTDGLDDLVDSYEVRYKKGGGSYHSDQNISDLDKGILLVWNSDLGSSNNAAVVAAINTAEGTSFTTSSFDTISYSDDTGRSGYRLRATIDSDSCDGTITGVEFNPHNPQVKSGTKIVINH